MSEAIEISHTSQVLSEASAASEVSNAPSSVAGLGAYLSPAMMRRASPLLHQQCWCWGQDIMRAEGNLLLEYGFTKHRPPQGEDGSSAYSLDLSKREESSRRLVLWGFGFFYADARGQGGVFINRFKFVPKLSRTCELELPLWKSAQLPLMNIPRSRQERGRALRLLVAALSWIEAYESWVMQTYGVRYRERCLAKFQHTIHCAEGARREWQYLRDECLRLAALHES